MKASKIIGISAGLIAFGFAAFWGAQKLNLIKISNKMVFARRKKKVQGIVIHFTLTSSPKATVRVLEHRQLSTSYEVDRNGNIYEYADPAQWYAHATGAGANAETVAIDVTHPYESAQFSEKQIEATRNLVQQLADRFNLKLVLAPDNDRRDWSGWKGKGYTLFRHRNFVNKSCPGKFPMERLLK